MGKVKGKKNTDSMMDFFRDDSIELINANQEKDISENEEIVQENKGFWLTKGEETIDTGTFWKKVRIFFQTSEGGEIITPDGEALHSLFEFDQTHDQLFRSNFPFLINQADPSQNASVYDLITGIIQVLDNQELKTSLLASRVSEISDFIDEKISNESDEVNLKSFLSNSIELYAKEIGLSGSDLENFLSSWSLISKKLPDEGILIGKHRNSAFEAIAAAVEMNWESTKEDLLDSINHFVSDLNDRLDIQSDNKGSANSPDNLSGSLGEAQSMLDLNKLSEVIPEGGSELMPEERETRLRALVERLKEASRFIETCGLVLWQSDLLIHFDKSLIDEFYSLDNRVVDTDVISELFIEEFDNRMKQFVGLIADLRQAELELNDSFVQGEHDVYFDHFHWRLLTHEEINGFPPIIVFVDSQMMDKEQMPLFSMTLRDNLPVHIVSLRDLNAQGEEGVDHESFFHRFELASLAVSYRHAFVMQATSCDPGFIFDGLTSGLNSGSAGVYHLLLENDDELRWSQSARSSRAFPHFSFNGKEGTSWGSRFDITDNPQLNENWVTAEFEVKDELGELETLRIDMTYADYKVLNKNFINSYCVVPRSCWTESMIQLSSYLQLDPEQQSEKIPYIWMADVKGHLSRAIVSWEMTSLVAEKLDYWHFVQENGGVNSYHVRQALANEKRRLQEDAESQIEELKQQHETELSKAREESTSIAMERLTSMLLDMDTDQISLAPTVSSNTDTDIEADVEDTEEIEEQVEEDSLSMDEPWIETPLCTSCNECIELNGQLFKYNSDKMAVIGDPKAGTYEQLVQAAEKCPVKIIHPGKPLDENEANLDDLISRAAQFN